MAAGDFIVDHWRWAVYAILAILGVTLAWGVWDSVARDRRATDFEEISRAEAKVPEQDQLARYGLGPGDDTSDPVRVAALVEAAAALEAAAKNASGAAAAYAWLQAADCWKRAGKADERMKALEAAAQVGAPDLAGYAADAAWAGALRDAGRTEESIGHWRKMAGSYQAALREESLVNLALEQVQAGKAEDAKATAEEFKKLFPDSPRAAALAAIGS